jgi:hypothetical protein
VISVILYGRNDAHGYNLHRRAALSLNCIAEVLTDPDDEILFVDYNTPDELPTFVEALSDTLTDQCVALLRVLRVPAAIHKERFAQRTHLAAIEPVSRNAAVRRANPSNRWLLSTNTDMILLPLSGGSVSEICRELPDGFFGLPRFELPEWLWERLPRSDPRRVLEDLARLGPRLRLDEPTVSHEWIRYDAPGDFQLILRDEFIAIDGFDEEMLLGYHVDSNLSRRMILQRGSIEDLSDQLTGYHCNHSRTTTVYHGAGIAANNLDRFFYSIDRVELPEQRQTWGLADLNLKEVPVGRSASLHVVESVASVVPDESTPTRTPSDALAAGFQLTYDSGHILPFVADSLIVSSADTTVGYVGANPVLLSMLATLVMELGLQGELKVADLEDSDSIDELVASADVIVVDLGIDAKLVEPTPSRTAGPTYESVELPNGLDRTYTRLERLVECERARIALGAHPRRIVLVNSATAFWDAYVVAHLDCSHTTVHSRVRRATVKPVPDQAFTSTESGDIARRLIRWSARRHAGDGRLHVGAHGRASIAELNDYAGFGDGWAFPDTLGVWTEGQRAELAIGLEGSAEDTVLALALAGVCVGPGDALEVALLVNGERLAVEQFSPNQWDVILPPVRPPTPRVVQAAKSILPGAVADRLRPMYWRMVAPDARPASVVHLAELVWRVELPSEVVARRIADITFAVDDPRSPLTVGWSNDTRELGVQLRSLTLEPVDASLPAADVYVSSVES